MRTGFLVVLTTIFAAATLATEADAQVRPWVISIAGGPSFPVGELADEANTGYHVQGSVGFPVPAMPFGVRADVLWQDFPDVHGDRLQQIGGLLNATFVVPQAVIQPYGLVGVGVIRTEEGPAHGNATETIFAGQAGLGVQFPFLGLSGFLEARYLSIFDAEHASVPVSVGVRF